MAVAHEASSAARLEPAVRAAAERLFRRHRGWIYAYCLRQLRSREEAEDAVQVVYLNACRSLNDGFEPRADAAWLSTVAHNVCVTKLRSSGRRARLERVENMEVLQETVAAPERQPDDLVGLPDALAALPENQRRAILLREWQGLSYREVAAQLGLSQAAVETLIFRARRSLVDELVGRRKRRRARALHMFDALGVLAGVKTLLVGGAATAAVIAATAAVVATGGPGDGPKRVIAPAHDVRPPALSLPLAVAQSDLSRAKAARPRAFAAPSEGAAATGRGRGPAGARKKAKDRGGKASERANARAEAKGAVLLPEQASRPEHAGDGRPAFAGSGDGPPPHARAGGNGKKS
jgi:RNA polymerase sigma factor (sigma-70 family)